MRRSLSSSVSSDASSSVSESLASTGSLPPTTSSTSNNSSSTSSSDESLSSLSDSSSSEEEQTPDIIAQITSKFRDAIGTRDSRFANRTNPTLKWKEDAAYAMAESDYLAQQKAQQDAILAAHRARKIEAKRDKKARKQDKLNRKIARKMERKAKACDERAAKIERKMQILAELRLERLANVREQGVHPIAPWVSAAEAQHRATLAEFTEAETAKEKAMTDSLAIADDMGRRIGMLPALLSPSRPSLPEEIETTVTLTLRLADPLSAKPKTLFTISLKRFRHVETMFGDKIGERGCVKLGKSLLTGACPRLKVLNLGWNAIKYRGLVSLAKAFERGGGSQLVVLDLRSNQLNAEAVGSLFDAMTAGGVPELTTLILSGNVLGDAGGKAIAHAFLQGLFGTLHTLDVKSNSIRNDGCRAMFTAFTADCFARLAPKLELLDMRRNCINQVTAETFVPCPKHIAF
ncbi:unnamed protein product [Aphanomyces euteiches]